MKEMIDLQKPSKTLFGKLCFLICFISYSILGSGQYSGTGTFTKITALASLTDGYYVMAYSTTNAAMNNTNPTSNNYFGGTTVTPSGSVITNPAAAVVWKIQTNGTAKTIYNEATGVYVSYTGSSNAAYTSTTVTGNPEKWTFAYTGSLFTITSVNVGTRLLQYNSSSPRFACYAGTQQNITLYKMALSSDATLSNLTISSGTLAPIFGAATTSYTASVTNATSSVTVTPTRNDPNATIQVSVNGGTYASVTSGSPSGSLALNVGSNTIDILVTAQDGTTKTYTITVTRAAAGGNTLTTTAGSFGPYCNSSSNSVTLNFTQTGTFTGTYNIQISDASGTFPADATSQLLTYVSNTSSSVTATIPASYTAGTGYRIRVVNNTPTYYTSGDNGNNITINALSTPSVSIAVTTGSNPTCTGSSMTFTATPTNGGTPTYQWKVDGSNVGTGATYTTSALTDGQVVSCTMTSSLTCVTTSTASSNTITVNVNTLPAITTQPTVPATVCGGAGTVTLSVAATGSGLTYSWRKGGTAVTNGGVISGQGTNTLTLTNPTVANVASYDVVVSGSCTPSVASTAVNVTVNTPPTIGTQPSTSNVSYCQNTTISALNVGASGTGLSYQWYINTTASNSGGTPTGTNSSVYTPSNTTTGTYYYYCVVTGTAPCTFVTSNVSGGITVNPAPAAPTGTLTPDATPACGTANISYSAPDPNIYWETSTGGVVTTFPTTSPYSLTNTGFTVYVRAYNGLCWVTGTNNTGPLTIRTAPSISTQPSTTPQTICSGSSFSPTTVSVSASGTGITYQWYKNSVSNNTTGTLISGATSSSYTLPATVGTNYYYCVVTGTAPCTSLTSNVSGAITVNAQPTAPSGTITPGASPACTSTTLSFSAPSSSIYWETGATGTSTANPTSASYTLNSTGTIYARAYDGTCWSTGTVNSGAITVNTTVAVTIQPSDANIVVPASASFTVAGSGTISGYQWQYNDGTGWANVTNTSPYSGATTVTLSINPTSSGIIGYQYRCIVKGISPCADATSSAATLRGVVPIWTNPITGTDPGLTSPYTTGDVKNANITVSGITEGSGISGTAATDRYNANGWTTATSRNANDYFQFTLTPNSGYIINFGSFIYTGQASGTGPNNFALYSSVDGYTNPIGSANETGTTISLSAAAYQSIGSAISFRFYAYNSGAGTYSINDFSFLGSVISTCSTPNVIVFTSPTSTVVQDVVMPTFTIGAECSASGGLSGGYNTGSVTLTSTGCGLSGTLTQPFVNGIATFDDITFTRSTQTGITITASAPGFSSVTSSAFNVTTPSGSMVNNTIFNENFDGATPHWTYTVGSPTFTGSGGGGTADVDIFDFGVGFGNSLYKSHTTNNSASERSSTSTITFANATGLSVYDYVTWSFDVGSEGSGVGAGVDGGDDMVIQVSTDNGSTWSTVLTYYGNNDYLFDLSTASPVTLAYNANASYTSPSTHSAFTVVMPNISQFMFKMTATDNRTNENWVIDNVKLVGTTIPSTAPKPLPTAAGNAINTCPLTDATVSASATNTVGALTYHWSPTTNFTATSSASDATPSVNFSTGSMTYTVTITDADKCTATASDVVTITAPSGSPLLAPATVTLTEVYCQDAAGWTYYADPSDPTKWEFAIYKNGNTFTANVDLTVKTTANTAYDTKQDVPAKKATFTLGRYWNATVTTGSIDPAKPIRARFYYDATDLSTMASAAQAFATANSSTEHAVEWFKTTTTNTYDPANNTTVDVPNKLSYSLFSTALSTQSGVNYTEYRGLTGFSGGTAGIRVSPLGGGLPVKLLYLTANAMENRYIKLDWATATEINNLGFELERSADGINFEKIAWVDGNGNSNSQINYTNNDNAVVPNAIYYYRLRQVDNDGHYEYSNIVSAMIFGEKGFIMENLKPNPATNSVVVNVVTDAAQPVDIAITNMLGQQVLSQQWQLGAGLNGTTLDISAIAQGVYHVTVRSVDSYYTKTLAITR